MLERFPYNLPKHRENVIPADSEKKSFEDVSGTGSSYGSSGRVVGIGITLAFRARSRLRWGIHGNSQLVDTEGRKEMAISKSCRKGGETEGWDSSRGRGREDSRG